MFASNRKRILLVGAALILLGVISIALTIRNNRHVLHVTTDASSLQLELNDTSYTVNKKLEIPVKSEVYYYRAASTVDGERIVLTGKLDFTANKELNLNLNFSIYNDEDVLKAVCESMNRDGGSQCPFKMAVRQMDFVENYQWAVVSLTSPEVGPSMAVLRMDNGSWEVVDGPATDIQTGGYFPEAVERVLENER